jgi:hypothetical protein
MNYPNGQLATMREINYCCLVKDKNQKTPLRSKRLAAFIMYCLYEILVSLLGFLSFIQSIHYPLRGFEHKGKNIKKPITTFTLAVYLLFPVFYLNVLP